MHACAASGPMIQCCHWMFCKSGNLHTLPVPGDPGAARARGVSDYLLLEDGCRCPETVQAQDSQPASGCCHHSTASTCSHFRPAPGFQLQINDGSPISSEHPFVSDTVAGLCKYEEAR